MAPTVQVPQARGRPTHAFQAGPRRSPNRRAAVPPGVGSQAGVGAPLLPVAATDGAAGAPALNGCEGPAQRAATVVAMTLRRAPAYLADAVSTVVLPRAAEVVLGLADVPRAAAVTRPSDTRPVEGGAVGAEEVSVVQGATAEVVRAVLAQPLIRAQATGRVPLRYLQVVQATADGPVVAQGA